MANSTFAEEIAPSNNRIMALEKAAQIPASLTIAQPANWALSWHEMPPVADALSGYATLLGSDSSGAFVAMQAALSTGQFVSKQVYSPITSLQDDHNGFSGVRLASGVLLRAQCGHASQYQTGATRNELRIYRSGQGTYAGFAGSANQTGVVTITLAPTNERPNYLQIVQSPTSGRVMLWYNDDTAGIWRCYFSDDEGLTWTKGRALIGATDAQLYMRFDAAGIFTGTVGGVTSSWLPFYGFLHPTADTMALRKAYMDLATGQVRRPDTGALALSGASVFDQTNQETFITAIAPSENAMRNVRVAAAGRAQRIFMVRKDRSCIADFSNASVITVNGSRLFSANSPGNHIIVAGGGNGTVGTEYNLGSYGVAFWPDAMYVPDLQPGLEALPAAYPNYERYYRCVNNGTAYNSGAKLTRIDYPNGIAAGGAISTDILVAGVTPGIAADEAIMRYFSVSGARETGLVGFAWVGKYTTYTDWTQCRFVPVVI